MMINRKELRFPIIMFQFWDSYFEDRYNDETLKKMLRKLSITEESFRDPSYKIDGDQYYSILKLLLEENLNEPPVIHTLRRTKLNNMGMAGFAGITAVTLKESLGIALTVYKYFMPAVQLNLGNENGKYHLDIEMISDFGNFNPLIIEITLGVFKQFAEEITGEQIEAKIEFEHFATWGNDNEITVQKYSEYFGCNVTFGSPKSRITVYEKTLQKKSKSPNKVLHQYASEKILQELNEQNSTPRFSEEVTRTLSINIDKGIVLNLSQLACHLNMTSRTLSRKLAKDNIQFQTLLNEVRFNKAKKILSHKNVAIKSLALSLGFSNSESFSKAFKAYTGYTPSRWINNNN